MTLDAKATEEKGKSSSPNQLRPGTTGLVHRHVSQKDSSPSEGRDDPHGGKCSTSSSVAASSPSRLEPDSEPALPASTSLMTSGQGQMQQSSGKKSFFARISRKGSRDKEKEKEKDVFDKHQ